MSLDRTRARDILGVSKDASDVDIRTAYKRLALKWHPDKHAKNDQEATQKFQDISAAYKYLTTKGNEDEFVFTMDDMFDLFAQMFFGSRGRYNGFCADSSDDYSDDDDSDDNFWESVNRNSFTKKSTEYSYTANRPSASEASKNAEELMMEEERQKKSREKRKSKKKRQREKKREEKVRKEEEDTQKAAEKKRQEEFLQRAKESAEKAKREAEEARWREAEQARRREAEEARRREAEVRRRQAEIKQAISMSTSSYKGATNSTSTTFQNTLSNGFTSSKSKPKGVSDSKMKNSAKVKMETDNWASSDSDDDITGWDQNSAFFAGAAATINKKMGATAAPVAKSEKTKKKGGAKGQKEKTESIDNMDPIVLQSRQMAVKGNEMAQLDHYSAAIDLFTQAIELDPRDFRFFGNRSFCFDRLQQYEDALKDADRAITLSKDWPKGHFRKGRALAGLKEYGEAENAFVHVLKLDKNCEDAVAELKEVRIARLMEMGFTRPQSDVAIRQFGSVQAALDALLTNGVEGVVNSFSEDVYFSDEEDFITETIESSKLDSRNPLSVTNLWVGNLHSTVSEKQLRDLFAPFGEIISLRRLPDRFCAFINYTRAEEAARALDNLQGAELGGRFLLIKFPDHPITDGQPRTTVLKKTNANKQQGAKAQGQAQAQGQGQGAGDANNKVTGPVNGNECYFWRTTGCVYSDRCHYKHLKNAKGADLKPWQQVMYEN